VRWDEVTTLRLGLRRPCVEDIPALHVILANPKANLHNPAGPVPDLATTEELVKNWRAHWYEHGFGYWTVRTLADGEVVGVAGVRMTTADTEPKLNLYYRFAPEAWGRGLATEAASAALEMGASARPGLRAMAIVHPENLPSQRVAERVGLRRVGEVHHGGGTRWLYLTPQQPSHTPAT
jgi:RimJ/RimL family protein N-acetyltransferase